jgi:hypothetical protein
MGIGQDIRVLAFFYAYEVCFIDIITEKLLKYIYAGCLPCSTFP